MFKVQPEGLAQSCRDRRDVRHIEVVLSPVTTTEPSERYSGHHSPLTSPTPNQETPTHAHAFSPGPCEHDEPLFAYYHATTPFVPATFSPQKRSRYWWLWYNISCHGRKTGNIQPYEMASMFLQVTPQIAEASACADHPPTPTLIPRAERKRESGREKGHHIFAERRHMVPCDDGTSCRTAASKGIVFLSPSPIFFQVKLNP